VWRRQVTHVGDLIGATTISFWWQLVVVIHDVTSLGLGVGGYRAKALLGPLALADNSDTFGNTSFIEGIVVRPPPFKSLVEKP
jgi:hypothetical protein